MKILAAADIHGDTGLAKKLAKRAKDEDAELVILCGDVTFFDQSSEKRMASNMPSAIQVVSASCPAPPEVHRLGRGSMSRRGEECRGGRLGGGSSFNFLIKRQPMPSKGPMGLHHLTSAMTFTSS